MSFDDSSPPDWERLRKVNAEALALDDAGALTKDSFLRIFEEAKLAVGEHTRFLESILHFAEPEWLEPPAAE